MTFISPRFYLTLNIIGSTTVIFFLITYCDISKNRGNLINFTVFALISCIAGCTYSVTRIKNYADRVKLKKVNQELRFIADHDYLSGLYKVRGLLMYVSKGSVRSDLEQVCDGAKNTLLYAM